MNGFYDETLLKRKAPLSICRWSSAADNYSGGTYPCNLSGFSTREELGARP